MTLTALLELTKSATPGPWLRKTVHEDDGSTRLLVLAEHTNVSANICRVTPIIEGSTRRWAQEDMANPEQHEADAAFIAAAHPGVVSALLETLQAAKTLRAFGTENYRGVTPQARAFDDAVAKLEAALKGAG